MVSKMLSGEWAMQVSLQMSIMKLELRVVDDYKKQYSGRSDWICSGVVGRALQENHLSVWGEMRICR